MARHLPFSWRLVQHTSRTPAFSSAGFQTVSRQASLNARQCCRQQRAFGSTPARAAKYQTIEQALAHKKMGPFSIYSGLFFILCGVGMAYYFQSEKARIVRKRTRDANKGLGKPRIGGEFSLIDQDGKTYTSEDMKGKFALIYFGFTHCPDICPDELDKMAKIIDTVRAKRGNVFTPLFVTCDPDRDTPDVIKEYLAEFHPDIIGLTGSWEDIRQMCKSYRVYFSTPPKSKGDEDYLVDHSIYFYLMDPEGDFIEVIGREHSAQRGSKVAIDHIDTRVGRAVTPESWKDVIPTTFTQ